MSSFQLKAQKREKLGSNEARRIKNSGRIPAVIFSKNGNLNISFDAREFEIEYFKGSIQTRVVEVDLGDKKIRAIANKIELDPVSDRPIHIDFLNCDEAKAIKAHAKLSYVGQDKSPGLKKGGVLHIVARKIELVCENEKVIPEKVEVDISSLHVGNKIRSGNLKLPAGVKLAKKGNFLIASIIGRGKSEEEGAAAAAAGTPDAAGAAAPAAGAAAPAAGAAAKPAAKAEEKKK